MSETESTNSSAEPAALLEVPAPPIEFGQCAARALPEKTPPVADEPANCIAVTALVLSGNSTTARRPEPPLVPPRRVPRIERDFVTLLGAIRGHEPDLKCPNCGKIVNREPFRSMAAKKLHTLHVGAPFDCPSCHSIVVIVVQLGDEERTGGLVLRPADAFSTRWTPRLGIRSGDRSDRTLFVARARRCRELLKAGERCPVIAQRLISEGLAVRALSPK